MRVQSLAIVAPSPVPLRSGGAERLWEGLASAARRAGLEVDVIKLPVRERHLADLLSGYASFAALDLRHVDMVITGKYPAIAVDHPNHAVWMLHPLRGLYDRWPTHLDDSLRSYRPSRLPSRLVDAHGRAAALTSHPGSLAGPLAEIAHLLQEHRADVGPDDPHLQIPSAFARDIVHRIDRACLSPLRVSVHAAISSEVANRPDYFPSEVRPLVLHPPLSFGGAEHGPTSRTSERNLAIEKPEHTTARTTDQRPNGGERPVRALVAGRIEQAKRVELAIAAAAEAAQLGCEITLDIAGSGDDESRIRALAEQTNQGRAHPIVTLHGRVSDQELESLYRDADVLLFTPPHEDFGYVALEAFAAGTPVLAPNDGGGAVELIEHGVNGWVVDATPNAFAQQLAEIRTIPPQRWSEICEAATETATKLTWQHVIHGLTSPPQRRAGDTLRVVAVSTYPVHQLGQGGPERVWNLLRPLADAGAEVEIVSLAADPTLAGRFALADRFSETAVPHSRRHADAETQIRLVTGPVAVSDIAAGLLWPATPDFTRVLTHTLRDADVVVLIQPYLVGAVLALRPEGMPVILDAHNHESRMKAEMLPRNEAGQWLLAHTERFERAAVEASVVVTPSTEIDAEALAADFADGDVRPRFVVVPNGATVQPHEPTRVLEDESKAAARARLAETVDIPPEVPLAIFVGSGHPPNIEAGRTILELASLLPDVTFLLVGRHSELLSSTGHHPNVRPMGRVDDAEYHTALAAADLALNPMASGSGSNLKLTAYFAAGVPAVTTLIGARGIEDPERYATVCGPTAPELAEAIRTVLSAEGAAIAATRAAAARDLVEDSLDWRVLGGKFAGVVIAEARAYRTAHPTP